MGTFLLRGVLLVTFVTGAAAIWGCSVEYDAWYNKETGCDCIDSSCDSGWSWRTHSTCCGICCDKQGCTRKACSTCNSGRYKTGATRGHYTSCTLCASISGCAVTETCSSGTNSQCSQCSSGRYLQQSSTNSPADSCPLCTSIPNCAVAVTCTTSQNQQCSRCANGYFLSGDKKQCEACQTGCATCTRRTLSLNDGCSSCASEYVESRDRGTCISGCNSGEYPTTSGGINFCLQCPQLGGCRTDEDCNDDGTGSYCPSGNCEETHYADSNNICRPRMAAPTVVITGPRARLDPAGATSGYTWAAEIQQRNNAFSSTKDLSISGNYLNLEWKDFNGQPTAERNFRLRLIRTSSGNREETLWSEYFAFSCECDGRSGLDGAVSAVLAQEKSLVRFALDFHSYCANSYVIHRNVGPGYELNKYWDANVNDCAAANDNTRFDDLSVNNQITASLGDTIYYRVYAKNTAIGYEAYVSFPHLIQFWTIVKGSVHSQNLAGAQLANVRITIRVTDSSVSPAIVLTDTTQVVSATQIEYSILIQSAAISSVTIPVEITAMYPMNGVNPHRFDCPMLGDKCLPTDPSLALDQQTRHVSMDLTHTQTTEVVFFDMSTYTVTGTVTIFDTAPYRSGNPCGLQGVKICPYAPNSMTRLNLLCAETDVDGFYQLAVPAGSSVTLRPAYLNGTSADFTVESHTLSNVLTNKVGNDFEFRMQKRADLKVGGGPADFTLRVDSFDPDDNLNDPDISDGAVTQYLSKSQQQTKYINFWSLVDSDELVANLDANGNAYLEFIFRSILQFRFDASPGPPTPAGLMCAEVDVAQQNSRGNLTVVLYEEYGIMTCNDVSGVITVVDQVTDIEYECTSAEGCTLEIGEVEFLGSTVSGLQLPLLPGAPNLFPPHYRYFSFYWDDPGRTGEEGTPTTFPILVTGQRKMGDSFSVTLSEGNPRTILYDPPGGSSFSELLDGVTLSTGFSVSSNTGFGVDSELESVLGVKEDVSTCVGVGASVCKSLLKIQTSIGVTFEETFVEGSEETSDFAFELSVENSVSTSEETDMPGYYSDVVISSAFTVTYERTRKLEVIPEECSASDPSAGINIYDTAVYRPALEGFVVKTFYDIEFVELPKIDDNMDIITAKLERNEYTPDADGREEKSLDGITFQKLNATKANWHRLMKSHEARARSEMLVSPNNFFQDVACKNAQGECKKLEGQDCAPGDLVEIPCSGITDSTLFNFGTDNSRIFFGGGGTAYGFTAETSSENVETFTQTYDLEILAGLKFENELTIGSMLLATEGGVKMRTEIHETSETTKGTAKTKTVAFTLSDPDVGDSFDVEIWYDKEYGTPYFKTIAGASMCPGEIGTVHRMQVAMELQGLATIENIPENTPYLLPIDLVNLSPTDDVGDYVLFYESATNRNGLKISIDGSGLEERLFREIPVGEKLRVNIQMDAVPGRYQYDNLKLLAVAECELGVDMWRDNIGAELEVSLRWQQECAKIEFSGEIKDYNTFTVLKDPTTLTYTLDIIALNPDNFVTTWMSHPFLEEAYVRYRRVGDTIWKRAKKVDGTFASFGPSPGAKPATDGEGFANIEIDVTTWIDGDYEINLFAYCGNQPGALGSSASSVITGKIDRVTPRLFSQFAEPAGGFWGIGERIAARLTEAIDCRAPYTFRASLVIEERFPEAGLNVSAPEPIIVDHRNMDIKCYEDTVEVAFSLYALQYTLSDLRGKQFTLNLENVRDVAGNFQEGVISQAFMWKHFCAQVEFSIDDDRFHVLKDASASIDIGAYNANHDFLRFVDHPFLNDIFVRYRRVGDTAWLRASKSDGAAASFGTSTDASGFTDVLQVDVSGWADGEYELTLFSDCGDLPGKEGSYVTPAVYASVDRVAPRLFSQFAEPADGFWAPGEKISARMTEDVDCRVPLSFSARMVIEEPYPGDASAAAAPMVVEHQDLDVLCSGNTIEVAFSLESLLYSLGDLRGKRFTVSLTNVTDVAGNVAESEISWAFMWKHYCPKAEFIGEIADSDTFKVLKGASTINVNAYNPDNDVTQWQDHPYLTDVYVRYRRAGDTAWLRASKPDGSAASFGKTTDAEGFAAMLQVDVSAWTDGEYELTLFSDCGDQPGDLGSSVSSTIAGTVDRVAPRLFSQFAEPADGFWGPGEMISARMTEDVDCRMPLSFLASMVIDVRDPTRVGSAAPMVVDQADLDLKCSEDTIEVAFSLESLVYSLGDLRGKRFTVSLQNVHDVAGNLQEPSIEWSFMWKHYCPKAEFSGEIADSDTFKVLKGASTINVNAYNPDNDVTQWQDHPYLTDVYVRYRRAGDTAWLRASKPDGSAASFGKTTDAEGFAAMLQVDVSAWTDGEYELTLFSDCGDQPGDLGSSVSSTIAGTVDRVAPRLFSQFAEPADGFWAPGEKISARMTEDVDCRVPLSFSARMVIEEPYPGDASAAAAPMVVEHQDLDVLCSGNTIEVAFSLESLLYSLGDLRGKRFTVSLTDVNDRAGNPQETSIEWSFMWIHYCSRAEFSGEIADSDTFKVLKGASTINVNAYNPDNDVTQWQDHPYLTDVYVRYRRVGDTAWLRASKPDGSAASFGTSTDALGFATMLQVDVSAWDDELYELTLFSDCGDQPGTLGSSVSSTIAGTVDRVAPRLYTHFAKPVDGKWQPGDQIAARMTEAIDCRAPYTFNAQMVVWENTEAKKRYFVAIPNEHLDLKCTGDIVEVNFSPFTTLYSLSDLKDQEVTVYLDGVRDVAGNPQEGSVSWHFKIENFNFEHAAVFLSLYFKDLDISLYADDPKGFEEGVIQEVCAVSGCPAGLQPTVTDVRAGSIWVDLHWPAEAGGMKAAEKLYKSVGNESVGTILPGTMMLAGGKVRTLFFITENDADVPSTGLATDSKSKPDSPHAGYSFVVMTVTLGAVGVLCVLGLAMYLHIRKMRKRFDGIDVCYKFPELAVIEVPSPKSEETVNRSSMRRRSSCRLETIAVSFETAATTMAAT